jgi:hypothetical protein
MKLTYRTMIEMRTTVLQEPGREPLPLIQALIMAHGLPVKASIRLRTVMEGIETAMKPFGEQRDVIFTKYGVRPDEKLGVLVVNPDVEPSEDVEGLDEEGRAAAADKELTELLAVEYEGLPSIPASMLEDASDRAAELLVDLGVLGWLSPLIVDDLVGAMPAKRGK